MLIDIIKTILLGIIEGVTEWLPVSSTGHLILLNDLLKLNVSDAFWEMFSVVIQLGAIMAVVVLYFSRLNPLSRKKSTEEQKRTLRLWMLVVLAVIPSGVVGVLFDDFFDKHFTNSPTVAIALIAYGIIFIILEKYANTSNEVDTPEALTTKQALGIGLFQVLSIIPGTSRSGSTMIGGMLCGSSRSAAAEFSFFMAIPTMLGYSLLKLAKLFLEGTAVAMHEWIILIVGCATAFLVSLVVISGLIGFVRKHTFLPFGIYRIVLGCIVFGVYILQKA